MDAVRLRAQTMVDPDHSSLGGLVEVDETSPPFRPKGEPARTGRSHAANGCPAEKVSRGRRHVWSTVADLAYLAQAEGSRAASEWLSRQPLPLRPRWCGPG